MHTQRQEPCQTNIDTHDKDSLTLLQEQLFAYSGMETYSKSKAMRDALFNSAPIVTPWWVLSRRQRFVKSRLLPCNMRLKRALRYRDRGAMDRAVVYGIIAHHSILCKRMVARRHLELRSAAAGAKRRLRFKARVGLFGLFCGSPRYYIAQRRRGSQ